MADFLWVEKYRPKTVKDCILTDDLKKTFIEFVKKKEIPNLLLSGTSGVGKTTVAKALCEELNCDYIIINGSDEGRLIDTLRTKIKNFASTVGFKDFKIIIQRRILIEQLVDPILPPMNIQKSNRYWVDMLNVVKSKLT